MATIVEMINPLTGLPEQVDKLDHTAQEIDDAVGRSLPGAAIDAAINAKPNPNLLDNWYFGNPVNQRGQTSYTGAGYGIDRWRLNGNNTIAITDDGVKFGYVNNNYVADQPLEYIADGVYTLSVLFGDNTLKYATFEVTNGQGTGETSAYRGWVLRFGESKAHIIHIGDDAFEFTVKAVKLELGSQQTLAHQDADGNWVLNEIPDYGEQLARCQRYFQTFATESLRPTNALDFRPVMRTNPALSAITVGGKTLYTASADL